MTEFSTSASVSIHLLSIFDFILEALGRGGTAGHGATETAADAAEALNGMWYAAMKMVMCPSVVEVLASKCSCDF